MIKMLITLISFAGQLQTPEPHGFVILRIRRGLLSLLSTRWGTGALAGLPARMGKMYNEGHSHHQANRDHNIDGCHHVCDVESASGAPATPALHLRVPCVVVAFREICKRRFHGVAVSKGNCRHRLQCFRTYAYCRAKQKAVSTYFTSKQIMSFVFAKQHSIALVLTCLI